jgi:hypothetical protein
VEEIEANAAEVPPHPIIPLLDQSQTSPFYPLLIQLREDFVAEEAVSCPSNSTDVI